MGINQDLARLYATSPDDAELQKQAEAELFCKIAAQNGIDFNALNDDQVNHLWNETMGKTAEEGGNPFAKKDEEGKDKDEAKKDEEKKDEEKKEAAQREHNIKLAEAREDARADELGRKMAHAFADEADKIASAQKGGTQTKTASPLPPKLAAAVAQAREASKTASAPAAAATETPSRIDELAVEYAVKLAAEGGFDPEVAANRVWAVYTLGLEESTKLASTLPDQIHIRALEFLEAAKYPVNWA